MNSATQQSCLPAASTPSSTFQGTSLLCICWQISSSSLRAVPKKVSWILKTHLRHLPLLRRNQDRYAGSQGRAATCPINPGYLLQRLARKSGDPDDKY